MATSATPGRSPHRRTGELVALVGLAAVLGPLGMTGPVLATDGTATITGGTLTFDTPGTVSFTATLTGVEQTVPAVQTFAVADHTGSSSGWAITATSTQFAVSGGATLPLTAVTVPSAPTRTCAGGVACTLATPSISYPYTLPAAAGTAPTATKIYNAMAGTGMLAQSVSATMQLAVPATATAGTYTSTWTYSLISAP